MRASGFRRSQRSVAAWFVFSAVAVGYVIAEPPQAPELSTIVPAESLTAATTEYLKDLIPLMADEAKYSAGKDQAAQKANAITALAQVLGNHDGASPLKGSAVEIMTASRTLSRAKTYAEAKEAYDALNAAVAKTGVAGAAPTWERAASLGKLMEEVSNVNNRLRRNLKRLERTKEDNIQAAATVTAFAQVSIYDTHEVKNPADTDKWYTMMAEMRDAAAELTKHYQVGDEPGVKASLDRFEKSCETCHAVFHNE